MKVPTLQDVYIAGKKVIVRCGFDVPIDKHGNILDDSRIRISAPTINYLLEHKAKQIIIITHLGRPKNTEPHLTTLNISLKLGDLLGRDVAYISDWGENGLPENDIIMLENLRFNPAEKDPDPKKRDVFGKQLSSLADIYVNDSFSTCHRDHASMTSIPKFIPGYMGLSVEQEVNTINNIIATPEKPFVSIIGGVKADKLSAIENLLDKADKILVAGALGFTLLEHFGKNMGLTKTDKEGLDKFKATLDKLKDNPKVWLPTDAVLAKEFKEDSDSKIVSCDDISDEWMALDIGPETISNYITEINHAKTIIWNGPIGVFEFDKFAEGTKSIANAVAESNATSIIGGGDSGSAVHKLGLADKFTLVSSGGGASLKLFEGKPLIGLEVLK